VPSKRRAEEVCQAWALDRRCKSSVERVGRQASGTNNRDSITRPMLSRREFRGGIGACFEARRRWQREQGLFDPARLVLIDETWTNTAMVRARGPQPLRFCRSRSAPVCLSSPYHCVFKASEVESLSRAPVKARWWIV
jgi:hypothetical protein